MSKGDVLGFDASRAPKKSSTLREFGATSAGIQAVFDACDNHDYYNLIEALEPFSPSADTLLEISLAFRMNNDKLLRTAVNQALFEDAPKNKGSRLRRETEDSVMLQEVLPTCLVYMLDKMREKDYAPVIGTIQLLLDEYGNPRQRRRANTVRDAGARAQADREISEILSSQSAEKKPSPQGPPA
ncbi:hypothetical protein AAK684_03015 [Leptogranulimonas caecicola]|jgi:hypothetical protein|uniref:Uncharacterized protein n=1 Tax=Muricaecibacterium torontonense TaxID=3032871 RepID=A0A4S2EY89_9ACTN|nr:hypothetical protein [Muricaecibacterium torontonense]MCI8675850.1 hypothetical protein [Atopobiaceae bacterium]TGY61325.1 hypothetical protein E5334_07885 [Muricaecibacterium torontonense]BCV18994.1 hypothetical protein ATOBIA_N12840 [Atopobiaceae bacterium P1]